MRPLHTGHLIGRSGERPALQQNRCSCAIFAQVRSFLWQRTFACAILEPEHPPPSGGICHEKHPCLPDNRRGFPHAGGGIRLFHEHRQPSGRRLCAAAVRPCLLLEHRQSNAGPAGNTDDQRNGKYIWLSKDRLEKDHQQKIRNA